MRALPLRSHQAAALVIDRICQKTRNPLVAPGLPQGPRIKPGEMSPPGPTWNQILVRTWPLTTPPRTRLGVARGGNRILLSFLVWTHTLIYSKLCFMSKKPSCEVVGKLAIGIVFFYKF